MNIKKLRYYYFLSLFLVVSFLMVDTFVNQKIMRLKFLNIKNQQKQSVNNSTSEALNQVLSSNQNQIEKKESASLVQFKSDFKNEVDQLGKIQTHSEFVENRLQSLARQMEPEHREYLKSILNTTNNVKGPHRDTHVVTNSSRAMAIELLSRNQTQQSAEILKNYSTSDFQSLGAAAAEQELIFKAQAIEGLAAYQDRNKALSYLAEVGQKTNYKFLKDHVHRAEASLKEDASAIE